MLFHEQRTDRKDQDDKYDQTAWTISAQKYQLEDKEHLFHSC